VAELERYIEKIEKEQDAIVKKAFWAEYQKQIRELRKKASSNCEVYEDVKIDQGKIQAYDKVLNLPKKIISNIRDREQKRATNR